MLTAMLRVGSPITAALGKPQSQEDAAWQEVAALVGGTEHPKNVLMADISDANAVTGAGSGTVHGAVEELLAQHRSTVPEADGLSEFADTQYRVVGAALAALGDAIAEKSGEPAPVFPEGFAEAVVGITTGEDMAVALLSPETTRIVDHTVTELRHSVFQSHPALETVVFSRLQTTANNPFTGCSKLLSAELPEAETLGTAAFADCKSLERVYLPKLTAVGSRIFRNCAVLKKLDFPAVTTMHYDQQFSGCTSLTAIIFRHEKLVPLGNVNAFTNTPIAGGTGYVYVPAALLESYKAATNWVTYADQIRAIEDHPEICGEVTA